MNDTLYAKAHIPPTEEVYLWLGVCYIQLLGQGGMLIILQANVMLSYPVDEAEELLSSKLAAAKLNKSNCEEDLDFLREQITVCLQSRQAWTIC